MSACSNFTPHVWNEYQCCKCFRMKDEHSTGSRSTTTMERTSHNISNIFADQEPSTQASFAAATSDKHKQMLSDNTERSGMSTSNEQKAMDASYHVKAQLKSTSSVSELTEEISFSVDLDIIRNSEFQEFVKKLQQSQHVTINMDEIYELVSISGKKGAVMTSKAQTEQRIFKISSALTKENRKLAPYDGPNSYNNPTIKILPTTDRSGLSVAKINFLERFGQKIRNTILEEPGINDATIIDGMLQLTGEISAITNMKSYLEQTLYQRNISITNSMKKYLLLTCGGRVLEQFSNKYKIGTSLEQSRSQGKFKHHEIQQHPIHDNTNTSNRARHGHDNGRGQYGCIQNNDDHDRSVDNNQRGGYGRGNYTRGQSGRGRFIGREQNDAGNGGNQREEEVEGQYGSRPGNYHHDRSVDNNQRGGYGKGNYTRGQSGRGQFSGREQNDAGNGGNQREEEVEGQYGSRPGNYNHDRTVDNNQRGGYGRGNYTRGQSGRGRFIGREQNNAGNGGNEYEEEAERDDDDDVRSEASDASSLNPSIIFKNSKNFDGCEEKTIEVTLCSDSEDSLSKAIVELRSYRLSVESWGLTVDEFTFILKQQQQGKPPQSNISVYEQCLQIKYYLIQSIRNSSVHIVVFYRRGVWHVRVTGLKEHTHVAVSKIKGYLNDLVETEGRIPISKAMGFFLRTKASSDIKKLEKNHQIRITIFPPPLRKHTDDVNDEQNNDNHCLKVKGSISRISLAQTEVQNFLENLSEQEQNFPCDTWDLAKNITQCILTRLKKVQASDDYEAVGLIQFYNSAIERRQTTPKVTFTVVSLNEETADDVIQQCKDIMEGYVVWKPSSEEYRALFNTLVVQKQPPIERFRQEWDTNVQLDRETKTVIIPARSKMIADDIKETLQSLSVGNASRVDRISEIIPIQLNTRRFVYYAIRSLLDEARSQRVFVDSKNHNELTLHGRSEIVTAIKEKINIIIKDIKQKIVTRHIKVSLPESDLIRNDSYKIIKRIERETNTIIRDVKVDANSSTLNIKDNDTSVTITSVVNSRGQTILVKKGDITKAKDVDTIVNAANGPLNHAGGVDKAISDAAGPALDQECQQLIAKNGGVAIPTGTAVMTTAGHLPFKCVIHAIGPQYTGGNHQERPLLFASVLSSLRLAEQEGYTSVALPAISAATYGFPLQDCTNIVIRAVKQFFADFPESSVRKVVLLDIDDSACNSFAREVVNDHTSTVLDNNDDDDIMNYKLSPLTSKWCWQDDDDEKLNDDTQTRQIEAAFQQYLQTAIPSTLKINYDNRKSGTIVCYSIHFLPNLNQVLKGNPNALNNRIVCGYQMRESTNFKRDIIRYPYVQQKQTISVAYCPKPLDIYYLEVVASADDWEITGVINTAVQQAEISIRKAIESATISQPFSVNLNEDVDVHKQAISTIAIQQLIQIDFQSDSTEKLSMILKGLSQNVLQAQLKIALYAQDILKMEADKDDELNTPKEWGDQEEECKLVELPKNHPDFIRIENRMKETLSNVKIDKIERVQNLRFWNHYAFRRQTLQQELSNKPNLQIEMELFHGTKTTLPSEVYNGEYGFDMTFSTSGMWGIGAYFAKNASYSCGSYAHNLPNGKCQVFLAQVLAGDVHDCSSDSTLRRPPKKNEASVSGIRYNSVSGDTGGSKVYIVYENRVAYPTYLITFSQ